MEHFACVSKMHEKFKHSNLIMNMEERIPTGISKARMERHGDYDAFIARHDKATRTRSTDECYTPPAAYDAVLQWVLANCPRCAITSLRTKRWRK